MKRKLRWSSSSEHRTLSLTAAKPSTASLSATIATMFLLCGGTLSKGQEALGAAPVHCSICNDPSERISKPDVVVSIPNVGSLTCTEFNELLSAGGGGNIDDCHQSAELESISTLCGCTASSQCQLCGRASDEKDLLLFPSNKISWDLLPTKIADAALIMGFVAQPVEDLSCQDMQSLLWETVHRDNAVCSISQAFFADYCGCLDDNSLGVVDAAQTRCSICPLDDNQETADFNSRKLIDSLLPIDWIETCGDLETAANLFFVEESEQCTDAQRTFAAFCECNSRNGGVAENPCTLCPSGGGQTVTYPEKVVPFVEASSLFPNMTCGLYESTLMAWKADDERCDLARSNSVLARFCRCLSTTEDETSSSVAALDDPCLFCDGSEGGIPDEFRNRMVSFLDSDDVKQLEAIGVRPTCEYVKMFLQSSVSAADPTCYKFQSRAWQCGCDDGIWLYASSENETQAKATAWVPRASGVLSLLGALCILWDILTCPDRRKRVYCQLVTGMAIFDASSAIPWVLSTLAVPKLLDDGDPSGVYGARGNHATCQAQAFFVQLGLATFLWNISISTYYLLVIVYNWKERRLRKVKPWLIWCPVLLSTMVAFAAFPFYDWNPFVCHFAYLPASDNMRVLYGYVFAPILVCLVTLTALVLTIYLSVRTKTRRSTRYVYSTKTSIEQKVFVQCFCYLAAFLFTWPAILIGFMATSLDSNNNNGAPYGLVITLLLLGPLQGFANSIVYFRPRLIHQCCSLIRGGGSQRQMSEEELGQSRRNRMKKLLRRHQQGQLALTAPSSGASSNPFASKEMRTVVENNQELHGDQETLEPDLAAGTLPLDPLASPGTPSHDPSSGISHEPGDTVRQRRKSVFRRLTFVARRGLNAPSEESEASRRSRIPDIPEDDEIPSEDGGEAITAPPSLYRNTDVSYQDPSLFIANEENMWDDWDEQTTLPPMLNRVISAGVAMPTRLYRGLTATTTRRATSSGEYEQGVTSSSAPIPTMSMVANRGSIANDETDLGIPDMMQKQQQQALMFGAASTSASSLLNGNGSSSWDVLMGSRSGMMSDDSSSDEFLPSTVRPIGRMVPSNSPGAPSNSRSKLVTFKEMTESRSDDIFSCVDFMMSQSSNLSSDGVSNMADGTPRPPINHTSKDRMDDGVANYQAEHADDFVEGGSTETNDRIDEANSGNSVGCEPRAVLLNTTFEKEAPDNGGAKEAEHIASVDNQSSTDDESGGSSNGDHASERIDDGSKCARIGFETGAVVDDTPRDEAADENGPQIHHTSECGVGGVSKAERVEDAVNNHSTVESVGGRSSGDAHEQVDECARIGSEPGAAVNDTPQDEAVGDEANQIQHTSKRSVGDAPETENVDDVVNNNSNVESVGCGRGVDHGRIDEASDGYARL